jgi:hypothetical protein
MNKVEVDFKLELSRLIVFDKTSNSPATSFAAALGSQHRSFTLGTRPAAFSALKHQHMTISKNHWGGVPAHRVHALLCLR